MEVIFISWNNDPELKLTVCKDALDHLRFIPLATISENI